MWLYAPIVAALRHTDGEGWGGMGRDGEGWGNMTSPPGALCNVTLQRSFERGLFSHGHSPLVTLGNVTRNPLYRVKTWDAATRHEKRYSTIQRT